MAYKAFTATATYSDGSVRDVTPYVTWTSGSTSVGTVVQTTGVVTGLADGSSQLSASFGGKTSSVALTVKYATLASVTLTPAAVILPIASTQALTARATYSDGTVVDITTAAVWGSSGPLVATVAANTGVVLAVSPGTAVVTAASGGKSGSATLTVTTAVGRAGVSLGSSGNFVALAKTKISTTGTIAIVGDIGVSPAAASFITGFGLIADSTNTFSTSSLVIGKVYAANYSAPTPTYMTTAIGDMQTA